MKFLEKADKLSKLLDLIEDVQVDGDVAVVRLSKNLAVVSEGSIMTVSKGLAVSISQFRHDNPITSADAFASLTYTTSAGFLRDLTRTSIKLQAERRKAVGAQGQKESGCAGDCNCECSSPATTQTGGASQRSDESRTNATRSSSGTVADPADDLMRQILLADMVDAVDTARVPAKAAERDDCPAPAPASRASYADESRDSAPCSSTERTSSPSYSWSSADSGSRYSSSDSGYSSSSSDSGSSSSSSCD